MTILWFVWRELLSRRGRAYGTVLVVASAVALSVTIELVSRAREAAVALQLDAVGPALRVLPTGTTPRSIVQDAPDQPSLPPGTVEGVRKAAGSDLTSLENRRMAWLPVSGGRSLVVWAEPSPRSDPVLLAGEVAVGSALASSLGLQAGQMVEILGEPFRVAMVLASRANADDTAAFVRWDVLPTRAGVPVQPTELRLHLRPDASISGVATTIELSVPGISVLRPDRGAVVEREARDALVNHRHLVWWISGIVSLACLAVASHLDAQERRREVAMLVAIGAAGHDVTVAGVLRSAALGAAGGAAGFVLGAVATIALDPSAASSVLPALSLAGSAVGAAAVVGVAAGLPTGTLAALRDPVAELQDV